MATLQLIYASRPFGFDEAELGGILALSRANNTRDQITGALICRSDVYLQLLEGPPELVAAAFARISRDERHTEVTPLWSGLVPGRLFSAWAMRHDPARSWLWSPSEIAAGALQRLPIDDLRDVFHRIEAEPAADA